MLKIILFIGALLILLVLILVLIWYLRVRHFTPTKNKWMQQEKLNSDLKPAGFAYSLKGDYFYSLMDCWQRETGYCKLYDENAALFNMAMDCEPIEFSYADKRWLIELWKGQYGITTGAEIGVYNTSQKDVSTKKFTGTFYENISDSERLPMSFILKKDRSVILKRKDLHWWLTGFKLGEFSKVKTLTMDAKIKFPNAEMCHAFLTALKKLGYQNKEYSVFRTTVKIHYTKPHSEQPKSQKGASIALVQEANKNNCRLYHIATAPYSDTLDKLEYLKTAMPELYHIFLKSLYSKAFYEAFKWLLDLVFGKHPNPPEPPCPPTPPEPPCPPTPPEPPCSNMLENLLCEPDHLNQKEDPPQNKDIEDSCPCDPSSEDGDCNLC